ncbi:acyl-[acyl-carrier-protein] thioesterase [Lachnoclostridium edouardi]|uniref:acyl-[acyl-carrier-protein] thioesterase n=1 Tax=Lachnoclostridium edouardi TaxID=1926283 RepID=UPI000C7C7CDF|nr:acyl-ACP thioesterase domain-containing protein [Lachnoclostridium edouardi]
MYTFDSRVRYSETDENGMLSVTGIVNYLQDCSTFQSEDLGLGVDYLKSQNRAWWLSSWQIIIDRYPGLGEEITIGTWPYDFKGIYGYRNFTIQDKSGNFLVRANSIWFFFDTAAGRPVKVTEDDVRGYGSMGAKRLKMNYAPRRIEIPKEFQTGEPVLVCKHHIDTNHHVNNAQYIEIAREFLPDGFHIVEIRIEYKKAAVLGDTISSRISKTEEGYVVILMGGNEIYAVVWFGAQKQKG